MSAGPTDDEADGGPEAGPPRPLVPRGNPLRWSGGLIALGAMGLLVLLMAKTGVWRFGVPIGAVLAAATTFGLLHALGTFDDRDASRLAKVLRPADLAPPLACLALSATVGFAAVTFAVAGRMSIALSAIAITGSALASLFFLGKLLERAAVLRGDVDPEPGHDGARPLHRRHGAWLLAIVIAIDIPLLGSHGLVDPWETHYGEVAREIIARDDWISLWWAQDGWFWSKPVLDFWLQALSMATFGVRTGAGAMLSAASDTTTPWPEWAVRLPIAAMALGAVYLFYKAIAGSHGRRAGFFAGLALATMPQWLLVTHQTMTDMPFVASMVGALSLFAIGVQQDPEREVRLFELRLPSFDGAGRGAALRIGAHHLVLGAITLTIVPQIAMLLSQNVWFGDRWPPIKLVVDTFSSGSPGNCGLPGNDKCSPFSATWPRLQPALQSIFWIQALAFVLAASWGERRARRLAFLAAWWLVGLATLAKGAPGVAIPVACIGAFVILDRRPKLLLELEIPAGVMALGGIVMPWFIAMLVRHGPAFADRLLFHDMVERALGHVHDTNQGDDVSFGYYVWQLGYATFPWIGMVPFALFRWTSSPDGGDDGAESTRDDERRRHRRSVATLLGIWFSIAFALFSLVETKFHHYILPALPPLAGLVGIACDRAIAAAGRRDPAGTLRRAQLGAASLLGAPLVLLVVRDVVEGRAGAPGQARFMHLFTYNYARGWPDALVLRTPILAAGIAAAIATALTWGKRARFGVAALATVAVLFAGWMLDVYFVKASPHWGQRELVLRYLAAQKSDPGPLLAYQLNWKGENFYTGNHIAAFPSSGRPFREWVQGERRKGKRTFYVLTAPDRTGTLASEMGLPGKTLDDGTRRYEGLEGLTGPDENNKFVLVRIKLPRVSLAQPVDG